MGETAVDTVFEGVTAEDAAAEARRDEMEPTSRTRQRRIAEAAVVVAIVFLVLAVAMATIAVTVSRRSAARDTERHTLRAAAAQVTEAIIGFDHEHPNANRAKLSRVASRSVLAEYDKQLPNTRKLGGKTGGTISVTVRAVYASEIQDGRAVALVQSHLEVASRSETETVENLYTRVFLHNRTGRWIADKVQTLVDVGAVGNTAQ